MSYDRKRLTIKRATIDIDSDTSIGETLVAAVTGHRIRVLGMRITAAGAVSLSMYSGDPAGTGTVIDPPSLLAESGGYTLPITPEPNAPWMQTEKGEPLVALLSAAVRCTGVVLYYETTED